MRHATKQPRSRAKTIAKITGGILVLPVICILLLALVISTPYVSALAGSFLTGKSGRAISIEGTIEAHLWSREPRFVFHHVKVGNADWAKEPTMFEAESIDVSLRLLDLLRLRVVLPSLILEQPKLSLEKNAEGKANWNFSQNPGAEIIKQSVPNDRGSIPVIGTLKITDGILAYNDATRDIDTTFKVATINGESGSNDVSVEGKGSYQKEAFSIAFTGGSALQLRESSTPYPFHLKTTAGKTTADVEGTVQDPVTLEAFDVTLNLKGANLADLFPLTGIALPPSPAYDLKGHLTRDADTWHFEGISGKLGSSDLSGDVTWHPGQSPPYFEGKLDSNNLDMRDLAGFVGAHKKPSSEERVIPDAPLDISRLMAMNADVTFTGDHIKTPELLDNFLMKINLKDGVLLLDPLSFGMAKGKVESHLRIEGKQTPPQADLDVHFERLELSSMFKGLAEKFGEKNVSAGRFGGKAKLHGFGKSLHEILATSDGTIDFGMEGGLLSQLLLQLAGLDLYRAAGLFVKGDKPAAVNCIVADFSVEDGIMQAQTFLIDTSVSAIAGTGQMNLKDESVNLELRAYPKKPSLLSLRSPITLGGTLKHLSPGVNPASLVVRGGAAALLAAAAPPAALLAFVGPALGEDSNCAGLLKTIPADAQAKNAKTVVPQ